MIELAVLLYLHHRNARILFIVNGEVKEETFIYNKDQYEFSTFFFFGKKIEVVLEEQ